jgi:ribosomal protein S18 acetylase RimI-like enzyme
MREKLPRIEHAYCDISARGVIGHGAVEFCMPKTAKGVEVRRATPADAPTVSAITDAAYSKWIHLIGRKPEPMTVDYAEMIASHSVFMLTLNGEPAAVLVLKNEEDQTLIWSVAVHPSYQKRGLGLHLLRHAEAEARARGTTKIRLYTNSLFDENIALYRWFGYEETGREPFRGSTLVHMAKNLE